MVTGKCYIGQTCRTMEIRRREHLNAASNISRSVHPTPLHLAISMEGSGNFAWEILETCLDATELNIRERYYIRLFNSKEPTGYNQTIGGHMDGAMSESIRERISESVSALHKDPEYQSRVYPKLKGRSPPNKGVPMSEGQKIKVGAARKAAYEVPGYVNPNVGQKRTGEALDNLHEAYKTRELPTGDAWNKAHADQYTEEVRLKMRKAKLDKKPANTKKVLCIETGIVYAGLTDASIGTGANRQSIYLQIKGKIKATKGLHFKYV